MAAEHVKHLSFLLDPVMRLHAERDRVETAFHFVPGQKTPADAREFMLGGQAPNAEG